LFRYVLYLLTLNFKMCPDCLTYSLHQYKIQQSYPLYVLLSLIAVLLLGPCRQIHW